MVFRRMLGGSLKDRGLIFQRIRSVFRRMGLGFSEGILVNWIFRERTIYLSIGFGFNYIIKIEWRQPRFQEKKAVISANANYQ